MHVDGSCHCGFVTYEAEVDPAQAEICHCTDCQTLTGTAFRVSVTTPVANFRLLSGEPRTYVRIAESGNRRAQGFCPRCGTPLWSTQEKNQTSYTLRVGALKQRDSLPPQRQYWTRSAQHWVDDLGQLPKFEKE
jgi:hypothetical protein